MNKFVAIYNTIKKDLSEGKEEQKKVVGQIDLECAWCKKSLGKTDTTNKKDIENKAKSHGICQKCRDELLTDFNKKKERGEIKPYKSKK